MECYCHLRYIQDKLSDGKTPQERRFGEPFKGPIVPFGLLVECHPLSTKDQSRTHQFGKNVLRGIFRGYVLYVGRIWKGDIMVEDIEELDKMDASKIHAGRLGRRPEPENIHLDTESTFSRGKSPTTYLSRLISGCR